ncbi:MAG: LuxR C-terminal-related transcriptional regulator [Opitutaceae bacterium]
MIEPQDPTASWADIFAGLPQRSRLIERLSPAERSVAAHVRHGLSNREIARTLGKSEATVKNQVSSCLKKLGVRNRLQLILQLGAVESGG